MRELERVVLLKVIDARWMNHIDDMEQLRQGIGLTAFAQHDPKVEYRMYGFEMFEEMTEQIQEETLRVLYHVRIQQKVEREPAAKVTGDQQGRYARRSPYSARRRRSIRTIRAPAAAARSTRTATAVPASRRWSEGLQEHEHINWYATRGRQYPRGLPAF